jgi:superfamily I DNA/RNA helicase
MSDQTDTSNPSAERPDPLADLNPAQREAAEFGVAGAPGDDGPLLVIAGAGSGKTNTLAHRVAHLILNGADPQRMLLLTFSRRAALEMERRVGSVLQRVMRLRATQQAPSLPWAGTFHAIGARLLRDCAQRIGLSEAFTIHDRGDAEDLMGMVRHELGLSSTKSRFPLKGTCLAIYSRVVNSQTPVADVLKTSFPWCAQWEDELKNLFRAYVAAKQDQQVLDYDDLLLYWAEMMGDPGIAADVGARFDHVLVDEYQDTNRLQSAILLAMKPDGRGLTVVGDDAQSIYSFRAATVRNILDFPNQFPNPARVITLDRNYRSTQPILNASNAVIGLATAGKLMDAMSASAEPLRALREFKPGAAAQEEWGAFADTYAALCDPALKWPADVDLALRWYGAQLERLYDDARVRRADLDQLVRIAAGYGSRERFLTELTLDPPDATSDESGAPHRDEDYMILSTIHSAKGQEWKAVYVLNVVDGCVPSDMSTGTAEEIEEERRLLYVAMTRAKERLQLIVPQRFYVHQQTGMGDRHVYGSRTRYITNAMLPLFDHLPKLPDLPAGRAAPKEPQAPSVDVAKRVRNLFS